MVEEKQMTNLLLPDKTISMNEGIDVPAVSCFEEVEDLPERRCIAYSDQLSSTPSEEEIVRTMKRVGRDVSKVLQALSPNHDKGASAGNKKSRRGSSGHTTLPNFSHHERNEPRSETLT